MSDRADARPEFEFVIEPGKAREFARAVGGVDETDALGAYAHPAFLVACAHWMRREHSAMPARDPSRRSVHAAQRFEYPRGLLRHGTILRARQQSTAPTEESTEIRTEFWTDATDSPAAAMTTFIAHRAPDGSPADRAGEAEEPPAGRPVSSLRLSLGATVRYQGASGDFNPLHFDEKHAHQAGFARLPAVGMLTGSRAASEALRGRDPAGMRSFDVRWRRTAWQDDEITFLREEYDDRTRITVTAMRGDEIHARSQMTFAPDGERGDADAG